VTRKRPEQHEAADENCEFVRSDGEGGLRLFIWVQPGAKDDALAGIIEGRLKVRIKARAMENKANEAACAYLAGLLGVSRGSLTIVSGALSRKKTIRVDGARPDLRALEKALTNR